MVEREKVPELSSGHWFGTGYWRVVEICVLFFCFGLLSSCGASAPIATTTTTLPHPQPTIPAGPYHTTVQTFDGNFTITLDITPNHSGQNRFSMRVVDNSTHKMAEHVIITLYTTMQDMPMGTDSVVLHAEGGGQFSAMSDVLSMGGHWALGVTIQTTNHIIHKAGVSLIVKRDTAYFML